MYLEEWIGIAVQLSYILLEIDTPYDNDWYFNGKVLIQLNQKWRTELIANGPNHSKILLRILIYMSSLEQTPILILFPSLEDNF